ncbi:MAG: ABC transporter ATP-binding protein [Bdellovibrionales bacterium]|nr:ABC transporter ATP-binding protein [Bdellovibrionales bacterium]
MLLFEAGQAGSQILLPYAIKEIIDVVTKLPAQTTKDLVFSSLEGPLWIFVGLSLGVLIFSRASGALLIYVGPALRRLSRFNLYSYLQYHSHRFFTTNFSGSLSNRINEVSVGVNHSLWTAMFDFWPVMITFSVSLVLVAKTNLQLAFYLGGWVFLYVTVSFVLASRARKYAKSFAAARSKVSGKVVDSVTNILNTKMFSRKEFERQYLKEYLDLEVKKGRETLWFMEKMRWFQFVSALILQVGIMYMAVNHWLAGAITIGEFTMVTSLSLLIINDARGLSRRFLEFFEYIGNISDGVGIMLGEHEILDAVEAGPLQVRKAEIEFSHVGFNYTDGKEVFKDLNLKIASKEKVGLVGFSGSGKTTFVNLLTRLYDIQAGYIFIDSQDIAKVTQDSLRGQISMIPQDPMLFHRTLLENIRYGKLDAKDEEVFEAAKLAHADEFIRELPDGYQSLVGERGVKLSGGQRQRIAIARAILKDSPILILDEATSSLDSKTEKLIQAGLDNLMKGKTVVVIAHRLSTISHMDRIVVFDKGEIVEQGSHEELLKTEGHYSMLWKMQAGGFLPEEPVAPLPSKLDH